MEKRRREIAAKVRELRRARNWTQAELSKQLQMSQSSLSDIERGTGSFTAEQFLLLLKIFNVSVSDFVSEPGAQDLRIQNALARLGGSHLQESVHVLPSKQLEEVHDVVREALIDGSPRIVTALAPVLVRNPEHLRLSLLYVELTRLGLERRLAWAIENTVMALDLLRKESKSREWTRIDRMAEMYLQLHLKVLASRERDRAQPEPPLDLLDATTRSERTLHEVRSSASEISRRWGIISSLQPEDFLQALKAARAGH